VSSALRAVPLALDLGPCVVCAGFAVTDHQAIIAELAGLEVPGAPVRAVAKRRAEFLAGRHAARSALGGLGIAGLPARREDGSPEWPPGVTGSITHGADRALCAVALARDVRSLGIDVERLLDVTAKEELFARICSDVERAVLAQGLAYPEPQLVSVAFSAKESLYKCLYPFVQRFMDFSAARVVSVESLGSGQGEGELTLELSVDWSPELLRGRIFQARFALTERSVESAVVLLP
jgi:4'-phosphopantetheinyl transferase EntD